MHEGSIVFRTAQDAYADEDLRTGIAHAEDNVAFEIDQIDLETGQGWTVLACQLASPAARATASPPAPFFPERCLPSRRYR